MCSILLALGLVLFASTNLIACTWGNRDEILRLYNWEDYLAPGTIHDFEVWYRQETGKNIKVQSSGFSTNEQMYTQIASKKADFDLIVPSDYMVDRMRTEGLLQPLDFDIVYSDFDFVPMDPQSDIYLPDIVDIVDTSFDPNMEYSVPYLWGTVGILYDPVRGPSELADIDSWEAIFGDQFAGRIYMQDSVTDAFGIGSIWANRADLQEVELNYGLNSPEHGAWVESVINDTSLDNVERVREELVAQRHNLLAYAVDDANERLATASDTAGWLALVWSVQAGYAMSDNTDLRYIVPKEGSNTWIDTFAIPITARNTVAANYFLRFMLDHDVAIANMEYVGATTPVWSAYDEFGETLNDELQELQDDQDADIDEIEFLQNYIYTLFPPEDVFSRVAAYRDLGERRHDINLMWIQVKAGGGIDDSFGAGIWIVLGLLVVVVVGASTYRLWGDKVVSIFKRQKKIK